jgi:hypothetical protein
VSNAVVLPKQSRTRTDPHRLAWGVLLIAFAAFCLACAAAGFVMNYFLFQSTVPLLSGLTVSRGSVEVIEPADPVARSVRTPTNLTGITQVSTDSQSQAKLFIRDTMADGRLVAVITLHTNASLTLRTAARPRFNWSSSSYFVDLRDVSGRFDVAVVSDLGRDVLVSLRSTQGVLVNLNESGLYAVNMSDTRVQVFSRDGMAVLVPAGSQVGHVVPASGQGVIDVETGAFESRPGHVDLLDNSNFTRLSPVVSSGDAQELLAGWVCNNDPNDDPPGSYRSQMAEGVMVLRLERFDAATTHGRTSCVQSFGQTGLDLAANGYDYLALRATFSILYQSLNACGIEGSECPLMLRIDYIDQNGQAQKWYHGFYSINDPQYSYPLQCNSCRQAHEFINPKTWYTFDSANLFSLLPPDQKPAKILAVWFYASGHQYDVQVSEMALLGGFVASETVVPAAGAAQG